MKGSIDIAPPLTWSRQQLALRIVVAAVFAIAIAMRLYGLNGRFDFDGYDEGVYWQTLRAMSAGFSLYGRIFCSQPPAFPLLIYPFYVLFGWTIVAARFGVAALSLLGLAGAYLLGKALAGRVGGVAALVIVVATPSYLEASQTLQAEGPATALLFLTVGAAFMWWQYPMGQKGALLAMLCGVSFALGTLVKLLDVTAIVPILVLVFGRLWQIRREAGCRIATALWPIGCAIAAAAVASLVVLAPILNSLPAAIRQVVAFHIAARGMVGGSESRNIHSLYHFLIGNAVLGVGAAVGIVVAARRHDWRIVPLVAWVLATCIVLLMQVPLFPHHATVLIPPLVAVSALALHELPAMGQTQWVTRFSRRRAAILLPLAAILVGAPSFYVYYHRQGIRPESSKTGRVALIAADLERTTTPDQWVITDAQFVAGLANRDTPPWLVDTSSVRINSGYLTVPELIQAASDQRVHAVLFATARLAGTSVIGFHSWVAQHYYPLRTYGSGIELWIR